MENREMVGVELEGGGDGGGDGGWGGLRIEGLRVEG